MARGRSEVVDQLQRLLDGEVVSGLADGDLLERFCSRRDGKSESAFSALVERHGPMVLKVCRALLGNCHDADDAFQATFLVLARKAGTLREPKLLGHWLYRVAYRVSLQGKSERSRRQRRESEALMSGTRPEENSGGNDPSSTLRDEIEVLHEEIGRLPEKYRVAIVLCDLQGHTHQEAARRLGRSEGTVSSWLSRARERLRGRLSRRGLVLPSGAMVALLSAGEATAMPAALLNRTVKSSMLIASGMAAGAVSPAVLALYQGAFHPMRLAKILWISTAALSAGVAATGIVVFARQEASPKPLAKSEEATPKQADSKPQLTATEDGDAAPDGAREAELIIRNASNLLGIAKGLHLAVDDQSRFPASAIYAKDGTPLISWRVAILPFLGKKALYQKFHRDEPWDSPHNKALLPEMPSFYAPVGVSSTKDYATYYQSFKGPGAFFEGSGPISIQQISDGTVNTLMVVEAAKSVPWTKPEDIEYSPDKPVPALGHSTKEGFTAVTADGAQHFFRRPLDEESLRRLITRNGGEVLESDDLGEFIRTPSRP
ncbi:sigma-70 family RNA polymerase sigma factor [Singulisphaera rosea]